MEIIEYQKLLDEFKTIPIQKKNKTFMDICQYPRNRFEEICSRILEYYFNPKEDHGFHFLWFRAFYQCVYGTDMLNNPLTINFFKENPTETKKRIDLIIETESTVYAIENKINANLYNDLEDYSNYIKSKYKDKYKNENQMIKIVLTAHSLNPNEKIKAKKYDFKEVTYKTLFENVNAMLGDYITSNNTNQLTFMLDFMNTVNNKMNFMENNERDIFFSRNRDVVDNIIKEYGEWQKGVLEKQKAEIKSICAEIKAATKEGDQYPDWWLWGDWDLIIHFNDNTDKKIGIESSFKEVDGNSLAKFRIFITTWGNHAASLKSWMYYKKYIMEDDRFKKCFLDEGDCEGGNGRVYLHVAEIEGNKTDEIISKLSECYAFLKDLADKVAKESI